MYFNLKQCPVYLSTSSALRYFYRKPPYSSAMTSISLIAKRTDNTGNKIHSISPVSSYKFRSYITIFHGLANFEDSNKKSCLSSNKQTWELFQGKVSQILRYFLTAPNDSDQPIPEHLKVFEKRGIYWFSFKSKPKKCRQFMIKCKRNVYT